MTFKEMGLSENIMKAIEELGYETPTPVQEQVIPKLLTNLCDIIALAQTGTGKTAAFGLPVLNNIDLSKRYPQVLILSPTRELCLQIARDIENYGKYLNGLNITAVYGGAPIDKQISALQKGTQIVVATPGRILDLIRRKRIHLEEVQTLILDEADEMLKMGFRDDMDAILAQTPGEKSTLLFSATMSPDINQIARLYMDNPVEITLGKKNAGADKVIHTYYMVHARDRYNALKRVVDNSPYIYGIVFCRTRQETKDIAAALARDSYNAEALHGDLTQAQRDSVMERFRDRHVQVLVATDVAARGLDVNDLTHVIHFNLPDDIENYNHRSGRTGRAGKEGISVSIIHMKEQGKIRQIENVIRKKFERLSIPTGKEICENQLMYLVERLKTSEVNHEQIEPYMEAVYKQLEEISPQELIKRFVSLEFNRFLDFYKNAPDLNLSLKPERNERGERGERNDRNDRSDRSDRGDRGDQGSGRRSPRSRGGENHSRIVFNVGIGKGLTKREVIELICTSAGRRDVEIGQIEIFKRASAVEVDQKLAKKIISELNQKLYKGVKIEAEENYQFTGNDYREKSNRSFQRRN